MLRLLNIVLFSTVVGFVFVVPALAQETQIANSWIQEHLAELDTQFGNIVELLSFFLFHLFPSSFVFLFTLFTF